MQTQTPNLYHWDFKINLILAGAVAWATEHTGLMLYTQLRSYSA